MGNCCIRQSSRSLHLMLNFLKTILFSSLLGVGEKVGYEMFTLFCFVFKLHWVDLDDPQLPNLLENSGHLQFSLSKPVPHTLSSALYTGSTKSTFSRKQVSWFSLVGGLHPSPDFGAWCWEERSQHCKYRKGGGIPMTSPFHRMNRSLPDNSHSETCQPEGKGQFLKISSPTTHSLNEGPQCLRKWFC